MVITRLNYWMLVCIVAVAIPTDIASLFVHVNGTHGLGLPLMVLAALVRRELQRDATEARKAG